MKKITTLIVIALISTFGFGQSIFENPITDTNPSTDNPYTTGQIVNPNITVSGIGRSAGIGANNGANRYNARGWNSPNFNLNDYFEFIITPNSGFEIDFISFTYTGQASGAGPTNFSIRASTTNGFANIASEIATPTAAGATIDLSGPEFQDIDTAITFRIYGWGAPNINGTFSINDFVFNGTVSTPGCTLVSVWDGTTWSNGIPNDLITAAILDADLDTGLGTANETSFTACSLTVNTGATLNVNNSTFVEIERNVIVDGTLTVQTQGNFVQNDDSSTFTNNGTSLVTKTTPAKTDWFFFNFWSSPVIGETVENVFGTTPADRRFVFDAANYLDDDFDGIPSAGGFVPFITGTMQEGIGYAMTEDPVAFNLPMAPPSLTFVKNFEGEFHNGVITTPIAFDAANVNIPTNEGAHFNLIGNPYPSAIDFSLLVNDPANSIAGNGIIDGVAYLWSQVSPALASNPGNDVLNFSQNDYAIINVTGGVAGPSGTIPDNYIPSGQGFFVRSNFAGNLTFNNSMRVASTTSNNSFFGIEEDDITLSTDNTGNNRLWVTLTSNNGIFNQVLIGYVQGATNDNDGASFDTSRISPPGITSILYTSIDNSNFKFAIQGRDPNGLSDTEIIGLGFDTNIPTEENTTYTLSVTQFEGVFFDTATVFLVDNLLGVSHNLSNSDYSFNSEVGEFQDRFEIRFEDITLSTEEFQIAENNLAIIELDNGDVQFRISNNFEMENIKIIDLTGRELYNLEASGSDSTYNLSGLDRASVYIAQVELTNGSVIAKKAIKRN